MIKQKLNLIAYKRNHAGQINQEKFVHYTLQRQENWNCANGTHVLQH